MRSTLARLAILVVLAACSKRASGRKVRVAAASDLQRAFSEVFKEFHKRTGIAVEPNFGSSGLLAKQIEQSAPYFLFAAANKAFVEQVVAAGKCDGSTAALYGRGRIVVWTTEKVGKVTKLDELASDRFKKIAVANPDHAPYGLAAKQALQKLGLWDQLQPKLVLGDNIQATMLYAKDGNADAAIVALSLAVVADNGHSLTIDPALYDALDQQLVVCGSGPEADDARQLATFVNSPEGREIMTRYGFQLADGQKPR